MSGRAAARSQGGARGPDYRTLEKAAGTAPPRAKTQTQWTSDMHWHATARRLHHCQRSRCGMMMGAWHERGHGAAI
eukprot:5915022-Amphidinium_carterae.1